MTSLCITSKRTNLYLSLLSLVFFFSCEEKPEQLSTTNWDLNQTFSTDCCGWTGGDGVYSVPLADGRSIFIFGDTYLGVVEEDNSRVNTTPAVKNSLVIWDNNEIETLIGQASDTTAKPLPYFQTPNPDSTWFWPGHGFEQDGKLTFFLTEFKASGTGVFGFEWTGTSIATVATKDLGQAEPQIGEWHHGSDIHFGMATLVDKDDVYVFGIKAFRVYVAKTRTESFDDWSYWNGQKWVVDAKESQPLEGVFTSEQFSVFKHQEKYVILSQAAMLGKEIFAYTSDSLLQGWSAPKEIYKTTEPESDSLLITYNALAHPQFTHQNELLISYCVNSSDFYSIYKDVDRYRPRFIRLPFSEIDSTFLVKNNP